MIREVRGRLPVIKPLERGFKACRVMGADTETWINPKTGLCEVISLQVCGDDFPPELIYCDNSDALAHFMAILNEWAKKGERNVVFFHNLAYDLQALILNYPEFLEQIATRNECVITWPEATLKIQAGKSWFASLVFGQHRRVKILDSFKFTFASLDSSAKIFGLEERKIKPPKGLGSKRFRNDRKFEEYAVQDAVVEYQLGKKIIDFMELIDCPLAVSAAQMSAFAFRRKHLTQEFARPNPEAETMALLSFHGGLTRAQSGFYEDLREYDFVSAYPFAMSRLGAPVSYKRVNEYAGVNGVYQIRGRVTDRVHPILFTPNFKPLYDTDYSFVTGYEIASAIKHGEFEGTILRGYVVEFDPTHNPFLDFVEYFFKQKDEAKSRGENARAHMVKRVLNSLYGKTIQTQEVCGETFFTAGGLYHPFIATLITGSVRSYLHDLEHACRAVHSATDSVKTSEFINPISGLGGLSLECSGPSCVIRGKLYAHKDESSGKWKFASHGLGVYPPSLAWKQILTEGKTKKSRVVGSKIGYKRNIAPLTWLEVETRLLSEIPAMPEKFRRELLDYVSAND